MPEILISGSCEIEVMKITTAKVLVCLLCGLLTKAGAQSVSGPPTIISNSIVTNGANITLNVSASNSVSFYYQWQLNGDGIPGAANSCNPGTTNISYTITNAVPFDSGNYQIVVANAAASAESPIFNVVVAGLGAPITTNDNFASSLTINNNPVFVGVAGINSNSPATGEISTIAGKPAGKLLWYNWTATFPGGVSLTTRGISFDTLLGVYTGTNVNDLTSLVEDDDSGGFFTSLAYFNCVDGTTYHIVVAGYQGETGNVVLELSPGPPILPGPLGGSYIGLPSPVIVQPPANQIVHAGDIVTNSVTATGALGYQWFFAGVPMNGATDSNLVITNFSTGAVGNYYAQVTNASGTVQSALATIEIAAQTNNGTAGTPTNLLVDKFGDAVDLTGVDVPELYRPLDGGGDTGGFSLSQSFSTVGATKELGEPNHAGQPGGASYWYSYTALTSGTLEFDTAGSTFNTILAVYIGLGNSFSTLTNVGAAFTTNYVQDGQPSVVISNVVAGTKYFIAIDGFLGASGSAHLDVLLNPPASVPINTNTPPLTNNNAIVAMTFPENNYMTTNSSIAVSGTLRSGIGKALGQTAVQVTVNTNAPATAALGAAGATVDWTLTNLTLVTGPNMITAQSFSPQPDGTTNASLPVTRTVFLVPALPSPSVKSTLTLATSGNGRITGLANNASLEVNKIYNVTAVPGANSLFANWTSGTNSNSLTPLQPNQAALAFVMSPNLILQANFVTNPFTAFAGVYNGLFAPTNGVTEESSGFFTATIPASSHGAYSAKLLLDGGSYPFSGAFNLSGYAEKTVLRSGNTPITVELQITSEDQIVGNINNYSTNGWYSVLQADRAVFSARNSPATNYAGQYSLIIPSGNNAPISGPGGYGYATLTNNLAGQVVLSGRLGDGAAVSQSVPVSKDGNIPLYVSLYSHQGSLLGWLTVTNNPPQMILGTNLSWIKRSSKAGTLYAGGFTNTNITVLSSLYVPPASHMNNFTLTNGTLTISNGDLTGALIYSNLTIVGDKLANVNAAGNPPNLLEGVIAPATGVMTVTFRATGAHANTVATGVVLQDTTQTNAAGWFLGADQSGYFLLQQ
jgi:hypothetical protein